ncbi:MAG TPA: transaldolase [bacterium]|nr:transaldolase [bacterium]
MNRGLEELAALGQSVWLDSISRSMIESGDLERLIDAGVAGMTSNPAIFKAAISDSGDYDSAIRTLSGRGKTVEQIYDDLTVADIQAAADRFLGVFTRTLGNDGFVSLEINPLLADDAAATIREGRRLWEKVSRPNLMLKVPATEAGFEAVEELAAEGKNVNVTLIFSREQYRRAAAAWKRGVARLSALGGDASIPRSVASVFVSRVDTEVDSRLSRLGPEAGAGDLGGRAAVANCLLLGGDFTASASDAAPAPVQRVLWASTGTKNPAYGDLKYVEELAGGPSVNTMPPATFGALIDHGRFEDRLGRGPGDSAEVVERLARLGVDIDEVCRELLSAGLEAFNLSFRALLAGIEAKAAGT